MSDAPTSARKPRKPAAKPAKLDLDALAALPAEEVGYATRSQLAALPKGLEGDAATKWAQDKLVALLPEAVASVMYDLRYGTDKVRAEAADKVLRANGMDRREAANAPQQGLIVLNINTQAEGIPWLQRMTPGTPK